MQGKHQERYGSLSAYKQGGKYFSLNCGQIGSLNTCTLPIGFSKPLFATAISTSLDDNAVPHIHDKSKTNITVSMDIVPDSAASADIYLLAVGTG